jgi:hypothetical protein
MYPILYYRYDLGCEQKNADTIDAQDASTPLIKFHSRLC